MTGLAVSLAAQARAGVASLGFGIFLGLLYDLFFLLRALFGAEVGRRGSTPLSRLRYPLLPTDFGQKQPNGLRRGVGMTLTFLFDLLYAVCGGICFLLFTYWQNDGIFRFYYLVAAALGFFLYYVSLGRLFGACFSSLLFLVRLMLAYVFLFVRIPACWLFRLLRRAFFAAFLQIFCPLYAIFALAARKRRAARGFLPPRLSF